MADFVTIDGQKIALNGERNLLEVARKAGIEIPTFCYHSSLSVYGACRLCLVDVQGRGVVTSCSTPAEPGMVVLTQTEEIRRMRRIAVELYLANHDQKCPTCPRSANCELQNLARRLGVREVRFKNVHKEKPLDLSSPAIVRDPNKCVLCGDCVRMCREVQGVGALDFANRGHDVVVTPAFKKGIGQVDCVGCGQCAAVCPVGAITPRSEVDGVWKAIHNPKKTVIAQIAPAVRVALGEHFGLPAGRSVIGLAVAAMKRLGFNYVFDTAFAADLTVLEEANEFLGRYEKGEKLPLFTSCCPAWVAMAEQHFPSLLGNLSSCRSPQHMFGAVARRTLPKKLGVAAEDLVVVSVMPCTAKKAEAKRPELSTDGQPDVDFVLTTEELAQMIEEAGLRFDALEPASLDLPLGFKTGAALIFGTTGGVSEAVLRYAVERVSGKTLDGVEFEAVRGEEGLRVAEVKAGDVNLKLAVVHGLGNARRLATQIVNGEVSYDLVEVMACTLGCVGGAGQPITRDQDIKRARAKGLYQADRMLQLHKSQENQMVTELYKSVLGEPGSHEAHDLLHTHYHNRRRIQEADLSLIGKPTENDRLAVRVCVGTNCHVRGAQSLLSALIKQTEVKGFEPFVEVRASFCAERCDRGPTVVVGSRIIERCTLGTALAAIEEALTLRGDQPTADGQTARP